MIWFFEKSGEYIRCETNKSSEGLYELVITAPDGTERTERFEDPAEMVRRQVELERDYVSDGWAGPHGRLT